MNLVDSCGWLEYFGDGANASFFTSAIEDTENLIVPAICVFEVFKRVYRQRGEDAALQAVALMHQGQIAALDGTTALHAAKCSVDYGLPLADSVVLATSQLRHATLWTQDADFKDIKDVKYVEKKNNKKNA